VVWQDGLFTAERAFIVAQAESHGVISIYGTRIFADAGGLISYGPNMLEMCRLVGTYAGKILSGAKPSELPVLQPTKYELVINLKAAKSLGLNVPPAFLARADEVIE
jgi:putative ABC transport system substrate-binding protein